MNFSSEKRISDQNETKSISEGKLKVQEMAITKNNPELRLQGNENKRANLKNKGDYSGNIEEDRHQKMAKLKRLKKMEKALTKLCKEWYAERLECDKMYNSQDYLPTNCVLRDENIPATSQQQAKVESSNTEAKENGGPLSQIKYKDNSTVRDINNSTLDGEDQFASKILSQIRQASVRLNNEVIAQLNHSSTSSPKNIKNGILYNSTSEGDKRVASETPLMISNQDQTENKSIEDEWPKRKNNNSDSRREAIKRKRVYPKPSNFTEYLYEILKGRRGISTSYNARSSEKPHNNRRKVNKSSRKELGGDVYISPDLPKRGLGANAIRKERRIESEKYKSTHNKKSD
ncbi:uncharacterized protein LOC122322542 [Drosophila grimshawi]|uniref:uncharacterized protein LOC122322542 n=1 Tax=Drosophila grimshawi TaxID=7222 RepID=UPI000C870960|nr:uncharacterized protein LOC122322542 [Drosophila grimshawi]